ncbi:hypothetical protein DGG96_00900 [Legionella qingyii]|uniref:Uncharacterized protein n=1 Tax=Legionella qingyii TaxID=2184757 RepID=A0A317U6S4_9GAMM|nr:hypothetical protein [Legionella qingyii]PWY57684.1 hypothetical protein DGG96_00900 [Legionella qingyii]RUR25849.1 hypothetical protein ELY20_01490 [Legionella qingyii]RUR29238.1 hypothetical protein ELY16_00115 [Legionella qingyii]
MRAKAWNFFKFVTHASVRNSIQIRGAAYEPHNVSALQSFKQKHSINLFDATDNIIYRGLSVEHCLGCLDRPGLGISAMRPGLARFLKAKGLTCAEDLSPSEKKELMDLHVNGYSLTKGNTKIAHSFTYCPSVAMGFGLDAAKKSNFPGITLIGAVYKVCDLQAWDVEYDPTNMEGEDCGTSMFSYQCETIVPHLISPINQCVVINQKTPGIVHLDDLTQAKRFDVIGPSTFERTISSAEKMKIYQQLEIDKVIAFDDFATYFSQSTDPIEIKHLKAAELYENYKSILKKQAALVDLPFYERDLWVNVASEVAHQNYTCISAHKDGFTIEVPAKSGGVLIINLSDIEAIICLAPLFEKDPSLTLDQVKNGIVPCALNYLTECAIRKNKDLICQNSLKQCVMEEENPTMTMVI